MTSDSAVTRTRLDSLTGLRFFAAFVVFGYHGLLQGEPIAGAAIFGAGMTGVSFFYIVSGFVLAWSAKGVVDTGVFWRKRFARIYPAYIAAWAGSLVLIVAVGDTITAEDFVAPTLLQAWVPREAVYFGGSAVFWSLSCEAFFYALFPAIYRAIHALRTRTLIGIGAGCVAVPFIIAAVMTGSVDDEVSHWAVSVFPPTRLPEFVLGIVLALLVMRGTSIVIPLWTACALAIAAVLVAAQVTTSFSYVAVTIVPFALLVCSAAAADLTGARSVLRHKWIVTLGVWSYCFYLVHGQISAVWFIALRKIGVESHDLGPAAFTGALAGALVVSVIGAWILHGVVEAPMERRLRPVGAPARVD